MKSHKFEIIAPRRFSITSKGTCVEVKGRVTALSGEALPVIRSIYIYVGERHRPCVINQISGQSRSLEFKIAYRIGFGLKVMRFFAEFSDGSSLMFGWSFLFSGPEKIGERVAIPKFAHRLNEGVNVIGLFQYSVGLGEAARQTFSCLAGGSIPVAAVNAPMVVNSGKSREGDIPETTQRLHYSINVFHLNPPEMMRLYRPWKRAFRNGQYNIAYWFYELARFPDDWLQGFYGIDEIWVATEFVYEAVKKASTVPVYVVPTAVVVKAPENIDRASFGIPDSAFCVLSIFDLNSHRLRKNPEAAIKAFQLACREVQDLHLILKVNNSEMNLESMQVLSSLLKGMDNVTMITEFLSREDLTMLQACADVFISLHRSEGLGLNLLECMLLGKPVIATNWSGNTDFMNADNSCPVDYELVLVEETFGPYEKGQTWAEPAVEHAAEYIQMLAGDRDLCHQMGDAAKQTVEQMYSPERVRSSMEKRLSQIL